MAVSAGDDVDDDDHNDDDDEDHDVNEDDEADDIDEVSYTGGCDCEDDDDTLSESPSLNFTHLGTRRDKPGSSTNYSMKNKPFLACQGLSSEPPDCAQQ